MSFWRYCYSVCWWTSFPPIPHCGLLYLSCCDYLVGMYMSILLAKNIHLGEFSSLFRQSWLVGSICYLAGFVLSSSQTGSLQIQLFMMLEHFIINKYPFDCHGKLNATFRIMNNVLSIPFILAILNKTWTKSYILHFYIFWGNEGLPGNQGMSNIVIWHLLYSRPHHTAVYVHSFSDKNS